MFNGVPRILIVRLSAIGDVVRVLPALHALRSQYPNAQIDWAVESKSRAIVEDHPQIDRCLVFERDGRGWRGFKSFLEQIRDSHYDVVIDFHGIFKSALISLASRAPDRVGFARPRGRELSYLFHKRRVRLPSGDMNRVAENLRLAAALDAKEDFHEVPIFVPEEIQAEVDAYYDDVFDGGKLVIAMHAAVDRPEKQWPVDYYVTLVDALLADGRFEVLLTWGPGQLEIAQSIAQRARRKPHVAPETPGLKHYAWLVFRCDLYFGGDTGPMHMAAAMGTPVVAVFGGTDPAKHAPFRSPAEVLYAGPPRLPRHLPPAKAHEYLLQISPEMAYDACVRLAMGQTADTGVTLVHS